mmetsp:Transcript_18643/g.39100  ORF Transcript_18643/g.39100 Transcript_18643/m.39100 type:complete len:235 (+) Transcript_18643:1879-2583(+)
MRSSKSPRNFIPATRLVKSTETTRKPCNARGHAGSGGSLSISSWLNPATDLSASSSFARNGLRSPQEPSLEPLLSYTKYPPARHCANPSAIAVLPTPASPINTGFDLRRRPNVRRHIRISFSRPYTASRRPSLAISVKSIPTLSNVGVFPEALAPTTTTSLSRISVTDPPLTLVDDTALDFISAASMRQNLVPSNTTAGEFCVALLNNASPAHFVASSVATLYLSSYSNKASKT